MPTAALVLVAALSPAAAVQTSPALEPPTAREEGRVPVGPAPEAEAGSEPATFPVEVAFRVQTARADGSPAVPHLRVELGVGRSGDAPRFQGRPVLAIVESGEDGSIRTTLDVPVAWKDDADALVWARVATPGYRQRTVQHELRDPHGPLKGPWKIAAYEGGTVFGTVRTAGGEPAGGARVWSFREGMTGPSREDTVLADARGRFALDFRYAAAYTFHGRAGQRGSGRASVELLPGRPTPEIEIVVGGGIEIAGIVADPAGARVAGGHVLAIPAGHGRLPDATVCFRAEDAGGLFGDLAEMDAEGRFAFHALLPGRYDFHVGWYPQSADGFGAHPARIGRHVASFDVEAGSAPLELVLAVHRLEVTVLDHAGAPRRILRGEDERPRLGRKTESFLTIERLEDGEVVDRGFQPRLRIPVADMLVVPVEPDGEYLVAWQEPSVPYVETRVTVPRGLHRVPVTLRLGPPGAEASLTVQVLDPAGAPFEPPRVRILSAASGREVESSVGGTMSELILTKGNAWTVALPPGRYRAEASAKPLFGCRIQRPLSRAAHLPGTAEVELAPGEERDLVVRLLPAGHLNFEAPDGGADAAAFFEERWLSTYPLVDRSELGGGTVLLVAADGRRLDGLSFEIPGDVDLTRDWVVPGWPARCLTPLPPGAWTLRVLDGARVLHESSVVVEAGRATTVRW